MSKVQQQELKTTLNLCKFILENPIVDDNVFKFTKQWFKESFFNRIKEELKNINLLYKELDGEGEDEQEFKNNLGELIEHYKFIFKKFDINEEDVQEQK